MSEVLPCPFCGKEMSVSKSGMATHFDQSQDTCIIGTMGIPTDHPASVAAWNTRADAAERDALRAENERLRKVLNFADHMHRTVKSWQKYGNTTHSSIQACLNAYEKSRNEPSSNL